MRSTYKQLYYINRSKVKSDGTTSIMCRITIWHAFCCFFVKK